MTEYEVIRFLKDIEIQHIRKPCEFCGSSDIEFGDLVLGRPLIRDNYKLFDSHHLHEKYIPPTGFVFTIKITKKDYKILPIVLGGHTFIDPDWMADALITLREAIELNVGNYQGKEFGQLMAVISGTIDNEKNSVSSKVEQFFHSGLSTAEINQAINELILSNPRSLVDRRGQ